jgi:hypothetical protein
MAETNGTANTCWGGTLKLEDLKRLEREIAAMPQPPWTLIAPDGRAWQTTEPRELLRVLAGACYPLFPTGVSVSDEWKPGATVRVNAERIEAFSQEAKAAIGVALNRPNDPHDDLTPGADPTDRAGVQPSQGQSRDAVPREFWDLLHEWGESLDEERRDAIEHRFGELFALAASGVPASPNDQQENARG